MDTKTNFRQFYIGFLSTIIVKVVDESCGKRNAFLEILR